MPVLSAEFLNDPDENLIYLRTCLSGGNRDMALHERLSLSVVRQRTMEAFIEEGGLARQEDRHGLRVSCSLAQPSHAGNRHP
jgi:hypothetical protein